MERTGRKRGGVFRWHRGPPFTNTLAFTYAATVNRYDPSQAPDAAEWLDLDELERVLLVEHYHSRARVDLPDLKLHATIHVIAEDQLASHDEVVVRALARLIEGGLTRHEAIHAIGSVVAEQIYDLLNLGETPEASRARYYAAIERLTAADWRNG